MEIFKKKTENLIDNKELVKPYGMNMKGIMSRYNKHIGYSKRFHTRPNPDNKLNDILKQCPEVSIKNMKRKTNKLSHMSIDKPKSFLRSTRRVESNPLKRRRVFMSKMLEKKYQNIFIVSQLNVQLEGGTQVESCVRSTCDSSLSQVIRQVNM